MAPDRNLRSIHPAKAVNTTSPAASQAAASPPLMTLLYDLSATSGAPRGRNLLRRVAISIATAQHRRRKPVNRSSNVPDDLLAAKSRGSDALLRRDRRGRTH